MCIYIYIVYKFVHLSVLFISMRRVLLFWLDWFQGKLMFKRRKKVSCVVGGVLLLTHVCAVANLASVRDLRHWLRKARSTVTEGSGDPVPLGESLSIELFSKSNQRFPLLRLPRFPVFSSNPTHPSLSKSPFHPSVSSPSDPSDPSDPLTATQVAPACGVEAHTSSDPIAQLANVALAERPIWAANSKPPTAHGNSEPAANPSLPPVATGPTGGGHWRH